MKVVMMNLWYDTLSKRKSLQSNIKKQNESSKENFKEYFEQSCKQLSMVKSSSLIDNDSVGYRGLK